PSTSALMALERKVEALTLEILRLKAERIRVPVPVEPINGFAPAASKVYATKSGLTIGGYGDMLFVNFTDRRDDDTPASMNSEADFVRAVTYFGYRFDDHFVFNSAIELRHAEVDGSGGSGEIAVEFAYLDYSWKKTLGFRGGLLLLPVGFLNEQHEPQSFHGARRPEVEQRIIPTTWRENGIGVYGEAWNRVTYRLYLTNSLNASGFTGAGGITSGRQNGSNAKASDLAWSGRVDYQPIKDLLVGVSFFTGKTGQGTTGFPGGRFSLWEIHSQYEWRSARFRGLFARGILSDAGEISLAIDGTGMTAIGERMHGWYVEGSVNVLYPLNTRQEVRPFCRYEDLDTQLEVAGGFSSDPANDMTVKTCGVRYRPIPNIVVTVEAQNFNQGDQRAVDRVNIGLGYNF
ncbi:MAG: hypothetical protein O7A63_03915, partial [Acidobacteria bacterium]|nr:hypothetical protein [Acidobacteriota bacterium]